LGNFAPSAASNAFTASSECAFSSAFQISASGLLPAEA
jgi:hypothetical protein